MGGAAIVGRLLEVSGMSKALLSARSGVSRSQIDDYLKGRSQPTFSQLRRLADAADLLLEVDVRRAPRPVPEQFIAVLEFGDLFPRKPHAPPVNLGPVWRAGRGAS